MENDKYFTPDIEDLRVGYECDLLGSKIVIEDRHDLDLSFDHPLRTPYLTKEQIEAEGWKFTPKSISLWFEKDGITLREDGYHFKKITLLYSTHDNRLVIKPMFIGGDEQVFFEGECKDINTFRWLCKLLKINNE